MPIAQTLEAVYIYIYIDTRYQNKETKEICHNIKACLFVVSKLYIKYKNIKDKMPKESKLVCKPSVGFTYLARDT